MKIQKAFTGPKKPSLVRTVLINILFIIGPSRLIHDMQCKVSFGFKYSEIRIKPTSPPFPFSTPSFTSRLHYFIIKPWRT